MLVIRQAQMEAFGPSSLALFQARLVAHFRAFFPQQCATMTDEALGLVAVHAIERAGAHGIQAERDICKYGNLMFVFGRDFDQTPSFPWAARILGDTRIGPMLKTNRLYLEAMEHESEGRGLLAPATGDSQ